jgi:hypothetical protein
MYPFKGMTRNVAGTLAIPTVIPLFDSIDHTGSSFSMLVLAVIPPTINPVTPCSSGLVLVNSVLYTRGQLGAETVHNFPYAPFSITFDKFGIWPFSSSGRMMSSSLPFTPTTMTRGFGLKALCCCANTGTARRKTDSSKQGFLGSTERP